MPRASKEQKRRNADNGEHIPYRTARWEHGEKIGGKLRFVSAPRSRKNRARMGW